MGNMSEYGHSTPDDFSNALHKAECQLMDDRKDKRRKRAFVNDADPAFDPVTAALRQMHDSIAGEPIPDDFMELLDKIDAKMSASKKFS